MMICHLWRFNNQYIEFFLRNHVPNIQINEQDRKYKQILHKKNVEPEETDQLPLDCPIFFHRAALPRC